MNSKNYFLVTGAIFSLIFILHAMRIVYAWEAVIGGMTLPMWVSWISIPISGFLAYSAFKLGK